MAGHVPAMHVYGKARAPALRPSGDDVGADLVLDVTDPVLQLQLPLLEACELELVAARHFLQRLDGGIEVTMFLPQALEESQKLAFLIRHHLCQTPDPTDRLSPDKRRALREYHRPRGRLQPSRAGTPEPATTLRCSTSFRRQPSPPVTD